MTEAEKKAYIDKLRKERIALHVRTIRKSKGMSVSELAEKAGYETKASIVAIENGRKLPGKGRNDVTDKDIANALSVSLDQLWGRKKIELTKNGYAKLTQPEKTALTIFAPMLKALSEEGRAYLVETGLLLVKAEGTEINWEQTEFQKEKTKPDK